MTQHDIIIVGAGPAGLSLARALSGHGLSIVLIEQAEEAALAEPAYDGREIALTHKSAALMRELGLWDRIEQHDASAIAPLVDAQVLNGSSSFKMVIGHEDSRASDQLGWLISNNHIRRAAYAAVQDAAQRHGDITLMAGRKVTNVSADDIAARVELEGGEMLEAKLLVAADSRFSSTRRAMGIPANMHDFGRTMLVTAVTHERSHDNVAWEWFDFGQTLALLPMTNHPESGKFRASVVLTLPAHEMDKVMAMDEAAFNADITRRYQHRLGAMELCATRHAYPLVGVYPERLVARRFACVGDAAVGMHPVTAHGFNFGLLSVDALTKAVLMAKRRSRDIAAPDVLAGYERKHRRATRPLYLITQGIVQLYTDERLPAKLLRGAALRVGHRLTPFKRAVAASLTGMH